MSLYTEISFVIYAAVVISMSIFLYDTHTHLVATPAPAPPPSLAPTEHHCTVTSDTYSSSTLSAPTSATVPAPPSTSDGTE